MKKFLSILLIAVTADVAFAQETETRNVGTFTGVKVAEGIDVYLKKGDKENVKIEVTGTKPSSVLTEVSGSYLKIHMKDGNHKNVSVKVYVTYAQLDKLSASSGGSIYAEGTIKANAIEVSASSAGSIEATIDTQELEANASSAGEVELKGKAKTVNVDASTAGEVDAYDLESQNVNAEASTGGAVKISVTQSLNANASTGGGVRYRGNPDKSITNSSTGGSVKKSN
jgi:hypothetical protein